MREGIYLCLIDSIIAIFILAKGRRVSKTDPLSHFSQLKFIIHSIYSFTQTPASVWYTSYLLQHSTTDDFIAQIKDAIARMKRGGIPVLAKSRRTRSWDTTRREATSINQKFIYFQIFVSQYSKNRENSQIFARRVSRNRATRRGSALPTLQHTQAI